jgi:hypothetical protein
VGEGIRCSAAVDGLISSPSSSESEEGKNRSGSLFCRIGAAGDGEGEKAIVQKLGGRQESGRVLVEVASLLTNPCDVVDDMYMSQRKVKDASLLQSDIR